MVASSVQFRAVSALARPAPFSALLAAGCAAVGLVLCWNYPLGAPVAVAFFVASVAAFAFWDGLWVAVLPALLPVIGFAPWTGWITFEEFDLLVLAAAVAGHGRLALQRQATDAFRPPPLTGLLIGLFAISVAIAMARGVADAGGYAWAWYAGYHGPMNSLRLAKPYFFVLLLAAPAHSLACRRPQTAIARFQLGLVLGLAGASLAALWERLAYTGLLDFSSDYRTTAAFWEMHVGGAAFDGALALGVPFAVIALMRAKSAGGWLASAGVTVLAAYACLTTFSRGVYLAVPVGLVVLAVLVALQSTGAARRVRLDRPGGSGAASATLWVAAYAAAAAWLFPSGGYRVVLALWLTFALMRPVAFATRSLVLGTRAVGWVGGALLAVAGLGLTVWLDKGAYLAFAVAASVTLAGTGAVLARPPGTGPRLGTVVALSGQVAMLAGVGLVAWHWGGDSALERALPVLALLAIAVAWVGRAQHPPRPTALRSQGLAALAMLCAAAAVGVFGGGAYMSGRFATGQEDLSVRVDHWRQALSLFDTPADWALGKGMGRYPEDLFYAGPVDERVGDYRLAAEPGPSGNAYLVLSGGRHPIDWGEFLRVSQRVDAPQPPARVSASVSTQAPVDLHFEVCQKHLLYNADCLFRQVRVEPGDGGWQVVSTPLDTGALASGPWYAPRLVAFSVAMATRGGVADIDNLILADATGRNLLANGGFASGLAHWFFSSDRHHLPWHVKNMFVNVLFDQGEIGLALFVTMLAAALWRLSFGPARTHPLAPACAAALVGFTVVGLFDSLLDVPRAAVLFEALLVFSLLVRPERAAPSAARTAAGRVGSTVATMSLALGLLVPALLATVPSGAQAAQKEQTAQAPRAAAPPLQVGPSRAVKTIAEASRLAHDGDTVEVDAGEYVADVAVWTQHDLTLRAVGGRARLVAGGASAEDKGTWVVRGGRFSVEGFDFSGSRVAGGNGAGIRFEQGHLEVRDCSFIDNENGILTGNDPEAELEIRNSEFGRNGAGDGQSHDLYAGKIALLTVTGSYFHHARVGHLLKSRAAVNHLSANRLTDEADGHASYELEFPVGGIAYVVGNVIQQGPQTENPVMVSYGAEGYVHSANELFLVGNTLIDQRPQGGIFLRVKAGAGTVKAIDNVLVGRGDLASDSPADFKRNVTVAPSEFARAVDTNYGWRRRPAWLVDAIDPGQAHGLDLQPLSEYVHPRMSQLIRRRPLTVGAIQPAVGLVAP